MNAPAMPGRSMTWREWLDEYDPVEMDHYDGTETKLYRIFQYLLATSNQDGTAIGDEWRAANGRWSMRGKAVQCATDSTT
jgi:hypothetical protein